MNSSGVVLFEHWGSSVEVQPPLLAAFVAALSQIGGENLGRIDEIRVRGEQLDMIVVTRHELALIALLDPDLPNVGVREEAQAALDHFHAQYHDVLASWDGRQDTFEEFREQIRSQIDDYVEKVKRSKEGLFHRLFFRKSKD